MIQRSFFYFFRIQLLSLVIITAFAEIFDLGIWAFAIFLSSISVWNGIQQRKLFNWLAINRTTTPPESIGVWGQIFDRLYVKQKKKRSEIERLKETLTRITASAQSLNDGVMMVGADGDLEWWNQSAAKLLGLKKQDNGLPLTNFVRDPHFVTYFAGKNFHQAVTIRSPISRERTLEFTISTYNNDERLILVRDITRLKQLEQMRQDFVANASHELRTPLTVLMGYLETFSDQQDLIPKPMHRGLLQMQQQTSRMNHLVEDLLTLTRLDSTDKIKEMSPVAVAPLIASIVNDAIRLSAERKHVIFFDIPVDLFLLGYESELRSAFSNLIFNAVNYTPASGSINITWLQDERSAVLSVQDNGTGIDARHIPRLTERFYRADPSRNSTSGGTGLGLAIVKHVLQRHQGHIDIYSQLGKGSTFSCVFPARMLTNNPTANAS